MNSQVMIEPARTGSTIEAFNEKLAGTAEQIEWFDQHFYRVEEKFYPSVTTILGANPKWHLAGWRGDVGNAEADRIMREAQITGGNVHNYLNRMLNGDTVGYRTKGDTRNIIQVHSQEEYLHLVKLHQMFDELKPKVLFSEEIVYSKEHDFAGTVDLLIEVVEGHYNINGAKPLYVPGGIYVADLKTGKSVGPEAGMQTAAYAHALWEMNGTRITGTMVIHTRSQNQKGIEGLGVKLRIGDEVDEDYENFMKVYAVWKINPNPAKPKIFQMPDRLSFNTNFIIKNKRIH